jgi:Flp pilus assembly CpaF family ATPase
MTLTAGAALDGDALAGCIDRVAAASARRVSNELERCATGRVPLAADEERVLAVQAAHHELAAITRERIDRGAGPLSDAVEAQIVGAVIDLHYGLGGLQPYVDDPDVENINVNGCDCVWVTWTGGRRERVQPVAPSDSALTEIVKRAARRLGLGERRWDTTEPILNLQLSDGTRLHAVLGGDDQRGLSPRPLVSVRRHRYRKLDLDDLVTLGAINRAGAEFLAQLVRAHLNLMVAGPPNSGKTTNLRALCNAIPAHERIVTVEQDLLELGLHRDEARHPDCVALYSRQANSEDEGEITVAQLVRATLRMSPARVIVGEVLGDEVIPMLNAMSSGAFGSLSTIHAHSSESVFSRLASYALQAPERLTPTATYRLVAEAIDFVVFASLEDDGSGPTRRISSIREVVGLGDDGYVTSTEVWALDGSGELAARAPISVRHLARLRAAGFDPTGVR